MKKYNKNRGKVTVGFLLLMAVLLTGCSKDTKSENKKDSEAIQRQDGTETVPEEITSEKEYEEVALRSVYINLQGKKGNYDLWKQVVELPEVESYVMYGTLADIIQEDTELELSADTVEEDKGLKEIGYQLSEGEELKPDSKGSCLIPKLYAEKSGKKVGDQLTITTKNGSKDFKVGGIFTAIDEENGGAIPYLVYVTMEDFADCIDRQEEGACTLSSVLCKSKTDLEAFLAKAKDITGDANMFMTEDDFAS